MYSELVAVTSRSFSRNPILRQRLLANFPQVRFNEEGIKLTEEYLVRFLTGAKYAIIGLEIINDSLLNELPDLKAICKMGAGIDKIDLEALKRRQIIFSSTPGANKRSVSELVLGLIFALLRHLLSIHAIVSQGGWQQPEGQLLSNKTVGIIGFGAVGQDLARLLSVFGCQCLIYDIQNYNNLMPNVVQVDLDTLLYRSDIISLHVPLLPENYHLLGVNEFAKMKKGAILINTARGGLVDEDVLYDFLQSGYLFAAALDVFEDEPNVPNRLLKLTNFFATSHIGGSTKEAIEAMGMMVIDSLQKIKQ